MGAMAFQITSLTNVNSTVYSGADQRKHQSSASLAFVWGIHRGPVNSPHKWPVTWKMFPFDDVIVNFTHLIWSMYEVMRHSKNAIDKKFTYTHKKCTGLSEESRLDLDAINSLFSKLEIEDAIDCLKNNKSPGADNIPAAFIKCSKDILSEPITEVLNYIIEKRDFP